MLQAPALSSKSGQRHVDSRRRRLNRDLLVTTHFVSYMIMTVLLFHFLQRVELLGHLVDGILLFLAQRGHLSLVL